MYRDIEIRIYYGGIEIWIYGGMELGDMEIWRYGGMDFW